jgi:transposase
MDKKKRHLRFCGIDVANGKHILCAIDRDGHTIVKSRSFTNNKEGYQRLLDTPKKVDSSGVLLVGIEATAHYWYSLHDFLVRQGCPVAVLNPIQTAQQAKKGIRKRKTDTLDAFDIASLLKNGEYKAALVPGELGMICRQLTRLRFSLIQQTAALKQLIWSRLPPVWPEY